MTAQSKNSQNNEQLVKALSRVIPIFIKSYESLHGNTSMNGMPRRIQLSSITLQILFQNTDILKEISDAFFGDTEIKNFFGIPQDADTNSSETLFGGNCCILDNSGSGGTQQPLNIISNIFLTAIDLCVLEKGEFDETTIVANLYKTTSDFKAFIKDEQVEEVHLIGFSGFSTESGTKIGFGALNAFPLNTFQSSFFFGQENSIGFVIKEFFSRRKIFVGTSEQMQQFIEKDFSSFANTDFFTNMHLLIRNVRLALVLALSSEENPFPSFVAGDYLMTTTGNLNSFVFKDMPTSRRQVNLQLDQKSVNRLSIKYLSIADADLGNIEIAIKRLLSAVCSRDNDDDALIDAVMCWENIIGSESEVTFRICASIAKLLAKDSDERNSIYQKLKGIYRTRSSLVHGNSKYKTNSDTTQQAIFYAIRLLNAILEDNKMLQMESTKRSEYIMLEQ